MEELKHREILVEVIEQSLVPYTHFDEVEELRVILTAWCEGLFEVNSGLMQFVVSNDKGSTGFFPLDANLANKNQS